MIRAENLHKAYGAIKVLKGVSLEIEQGQLVAILGKSGAGKSTLLHLLGSLDTPDQGHIEIAGEVLTKLSSKELARFRNTSLGFIFQFHHLLNEFTALENVCMPAYILNPKDKTIHQRGTELLQYLGLGHRVNHKPNEMSGGEQQRVAVARALINKPKVILADEPTGNLDSANSIEMHELFVKLRDDFKQTFVVVTHNEDLAKMCDKRFYMADGQISMIN